MSLNTIVKYIQTGVTGKSYPRKILPGGGVTLY